AALRYFKTALNLLSENSWFYQYELTLTIYDLTIETEFLNANFQHSKTLINVALNKVKTLLDKVKIFKRIIQLNIGQGNFPVAIDTALEVLGMLGIVIPTNPTEISNYCQELRQELTFEKSQIAELVNLPVLNDPYKQAAVEILNTMPGPVYISRPELFMPMMLAMTNISVKYGNCATSAFAYCVYGLLLCGVYKDIEHGYEFGQLSLQILEKFNDKALQCNVLKVYASHIQHAKEPIRDVVETLHLATEIAIETGNPEFIGYGGAEYGIYSFFSGENLETVAQKLVPYIELVDSFKQELGIYYIRIVRQVVLNLLNRNTTQHTLTGEDFHEETMLPIVVASNWETLLCCFYLFKLILAYLFKDYLAALAYTKSVEHHLKAVAGMMMDYEYNFYHSLALLQLYFNKNFSRGNERENYFNQVKLNQETLQYRALHAPCNFLHKYELIEAEKARVLGQHDRAMDYYDRAIQNARKYGYIQEEALAAELAAEFYFARGRIRVAKDYLTDAYYGYLRWGATAKVQDLVERYPQVFSANQAPANLGIVSTHTTELGLASLDLATIIKASQAISGEILLEQLLQNLMKILIENAGAQIGYLVMKSQEQWLIEAEGTVDSDNVIVLQSILIDNHLPNSIINYVAHTCESVVLNDAIHENNFTNDPYIRTRQPKSILCFPLINQGKIVSIIYLENNLATSTFTPDRLKVLKLLSTQAAISIENARLYQTLEYKVKERTAQLAQANQEITTLNEKLKVENIRMSAELEVTRQLQQMILPKKQELSQISGLEIAGFMEPADEVGGDYYDVLQHNGRVKIGIGDITGHGLESGVLMIMVQTAVKTLLEHQETDSTKFLSTLNRVIYDNAQRINSHRTLTLALLDYDGGCVSLCGQHEEIIVVRADGRIERIDTDELGFPLGLVAEIDEFIQQTQVQLEVGDGVVLYTDGIIEAKNSQRQEYGLKRLCYVLSQHWQQTADEIRQSVIADVQQHIGDTKICDDMTLLILKQK
ncbi:MAG: SpoIIE family protein phosphatase, partial [Tolypothrix sp. Co-bin9]|nr:SpoIIE family protein phosphatase [Tolypothrix sp. Co-bin9]